MRAEASDRQAHRGRRGATVPGHATRIADLLLEAAPTLDGLAGHPSGHAVRTCYLAMRLAEALSIGDRDRLGLFYAALLHDAGSYSEIDPGSGRPAMMRRLMPLPRGTDEERRAAEHLRVRRGAQFATRAGFGPEVAVTIMALHERWDGHGLPMELAGEAIPLFARIVALADGLDLAVSRDGRQAAITTVHARSGKWYDPEIASVLLALCANGLLREMQTDDLEAAALDLEPSWLVRLADPEDAERIKSVLTSVGAA
ncbi:MAG: HD domain-containing protein [Chloroflexota bacterium]|nr:HD domain-containing protein [Chloroflexota bacterium]